MLDMLAPAGPAWGPACSKIRMRNEKLAVGGLQVAFRPL